MRAQGNAAARPEKRAVRTRVAWGEGVPQVKAESRTRGRYYHTDYNMNIHID